MDYMKDIGFVLADYQKDIIKRVSDNINRHKKMQTILLPNCGGKTNLSYILSIKFKNEGKKVLYYADENDKYTINYAAMSIRTSKENFNGVDFGSPSSIKELYDRHYDIIITDAIYSVFSSEVLNDFDNAIRNINVEAIETEGKNASLGQKYLVGLHYLQKMIERDNSYVISFDLNRIEKIGYAPIIAAPHVLTYKLDRLQEMEYGSACADEYENVTKRKMQIIQKQGQVGPDSKKYNAFLSIILDKLDEGFSLMNDKIDNLQNNVEQILSEVKEMNKTVKANKNVLSLYFSVHDNDDLESDLFISKLIDKMTSEMSEKITHFEGQEKYQKIRKLVMVRLGDNAWGKLDAESQKFLITAKFLFIENMDFAENIDFSSICLLSSKALEVELAKRFVTAYENFLTNKHLKEDTWPKGILMFNKKKGSYEKMKIENFTLGTCSYIMGILGKQDERMINRQYFEMFCKDELMKTLPKQEISCKIDEFERYIRHVKDNFRNPAAHKNIMSMSEARECLDYILEIERVLKIMLEQFSF